MTHHTEQLLDQALPPPALTTADLARAGGEQLGPRRDRDVQGLWAVQATILEVIAPGSAAVVSDGMDVWLEGGDDALKAWLAQQKKARREP